MCSSDLLALVATFSWLESLLAPRVGRLPMAHEFVRGLRYLLPLAWIMIGGVLGILWPRFAGWLRTGFCVLAVVLALRLIVEASPFGDINSMITTLIGIPMSHVGGSLPGMIISVILIGILWTLGLHGDTIVLVFIRPVWLSNMSENLEAFQNGLPIPHIITQQFYDLWIAPGGTGALLGLVIFMLLRSRSQQMKQLGKIAAPGALFNISEPMVFGIPLVMNPYFFLPFILTPVLLVIVSYTAMATGLVAPPAGIALPFTTPIFIPETSPERAASTTGGTGASIEVES